MEKQFIPYEQALKLRTLGFDELCLGFHTKDGKRVIVDTLFNRIKPELIKAPLWQQAFDFLLEKLNNHSYDQEHGDYQVRSYDGKEWIYEIIGSKLDCLKKLIELCLKNN